MATNPTPKPGAPQPDAGHVPMTEEMDSARWTLPPIIPMLVALAIVGAIVLFYVGFGRPAGGASGAITGVAVAEPDPNSVLVAITVNVKNTSQKPLWIKNLTATMTPQQGEAISDDAASAVDLPRYLQGFPALLQYKADPIKVNDKIMPGGEQTGMIIVSFPVARDAFDRRQGLKVTVNLYDRTPLVIQQGQRGL